MKNKFARLIKPFGTSLGLAFLIGLFVSYLVLAAPNLINKFNDLIYDAWMQTNATSQKNSNVVIVDIDEASLRKMGQMPWPRIILSDLVNMLLIQGVAAIGLDIWLTEPDRSSPIAVAGLIEKNFDINLDFTKLPPDALDYDRTLKNTIAGKPVVLGAHAIFAGDNELPPLLPHSLKIQANSQQELDNASKEITQISGMAPPLTILENVAPVGLLNVSVEDDGIVRSVPLVGKIKDEFFPALALQTVMTAKKLKELKIESDGSNSLKLHLEDLEIPLEKDGSFNAVFYGPDQTFTHYSAIDVLDGKIPRQDIENKIVFIGNTAHTLHNVHSTPYDPAVSDAEIHATIAENILSGQTIRPFYYEKQTLLCAIFLSALAGVLLFRFFILPVYVPTSLALVSCYILISWLFFKNGYFFSPVGPTAALVFAGIFILPFRYWHEQKERKKLRRAFSQYVAPEVASRIVAGGEDLLKGQQKEITILFTDVRGFTTISEKMPPQQLVRLLNCYFTPMTACVTRRQGTLDKFIGDALMAFWNAPLDIEDHAYKAVMAAMDMQHELAKLRPQLLKEFGVEMQMGIGINTGMAHVGNMGSIDLLDYTCIGENVNLASRLEGMCKRYDMNIVVSSSVKKACETEMLFLPLDKITVKGSFKPQMIYTPVSEGENLNPDIINSWENALNEYFSGDFTSAIQKFNNLVKYKQLRRISDLFIERCRNLKAKPQADWDGVWIYNEK